MKHKMLIFFTLTLFVTAYSQVLAQSNQDAGKLFLSEAGVICGYGTGSLPEGTYKPVLLICHFGFDLKPLLPKLQNHRGTLSWFLEPQINPVPEPETDIEGGLGLGLKYSYPLTESLSFAVMGAIGPHYITVKSSKMANGFLFSDTIGTNFSYSPTKSSSFHIGYRFRHMSSANLSKPNGGINTHFITCGYSVLF